MTAILRFKHALQELGIPDDVTAQIMAGYETVTDKSSKNVRAAFFIDAVNRMDTLLGSQMCHDVRDACTCSTGGWRLKATQKVAKEYAGKTLQEKLQALGEVRYMGKPILNEDGTITAQIGDTGGFECPCPVFNKAQIKAPVPISYCYCCGGHFRFHYQIALGVKLRTKAVLSSTLESNRTQPCRFVYEIVE
jgi:hypothetical protein